MSRSRALIASSLLLLPVACSAESAPAQADPERARALQDLLHQIDDACAALFERVAPSVVVIDAEKKPAADSPDQNFDYYFHGPEGTQPGHPPIAHGPAMRSEGSGFIVRADGYIYTNAHVIEDSAGITVRLRDGRRLPGRVVGVDELTDIAVVKVEARGLPALEFANSDFLRVGQSCFAIGVPYELDYSFCRGVISATGRRNLMSDPLKPAYEDYIQTDAFINPGNSGGPLFDVDGRVIGMNTLINGIGRGLAFAIPANMLEEVGGQLIAEGKVRHSWLGISVKGVDQEIEEDARAAERLKGVTAGVCVDTIEADAPAYRSDLRPYDVVTQVDGVPVRSAHDLQREILHKKVGQAVHLSVWRAGRTLDVTVTTDELPADLGKVAQAHSRAKTKPTDDTSYGIQFLTVSEAARESTRAVIAGVEAGSPAEHAGLHAGDEIVSIDQHPAAGPSACLQLLTAHRGAAGPAIVYKRQGQQARVVLDNGSGAEAEP